MTEEEKNIQALKQRAKEMLKDDNTRQIGAEEIYTIICEWDEWEKNLNLISNLQKENEEYEKQLDLDYVDNNFVSKDKIRNKIKELEERLQVEYVLYVLYEKSEKGSDTRYAIYERIFMINFVLEVLEDLLKE